MYNKKELRKIVAKYFIYFVIAVFMYILGATPGFMSFFNIKPCFVVPFCIALALCEEEFTTIIIYVAGGLMLDVSAGKVAGFFTITLLVLCIACMMGVKFVFKADLKSAFAFSFVTMFILRNLDFFMNYVAYGYKGLLRFYGKQVLLHSIYSALFAIPLFLLVEWVKDLRILRVDARWKA